MIQPCISRPPPALHLPSEDKARARSTPSPRWSSWDPVFVLLRSRLLVCLWSDEIVQLGQSNRQLKASFLSPRVIRASIHQTGPSSTSTRFKYWMHVLGVQDVMIDLLFSDDRIQSQPNTVQPNRESASLPGLEIEEVESSRLSGSRRLQESEGTMDMRERGYEVFRTILCKEGEANKAETFLKSGKKTLSPHGQEGEIRRDLHRTFPTEPLFADSAGVGQTLLANILKACLIFHPDVGYCQGMNYVAAALLFAQRRQLCPSSASVPAWAPSHIPNPQHMCNGATDSHHASSFCHKETYLQQPQTDSCTSSPVPQPETLGQVQGQLTDGTRLSPDHSTSTSATVVSTAQGLHGYLSDESGSEAVSPYHRSSSHGPLSAEQAWSTKTIDPTWQSTSKSFQTAAGIFWMMTALMSPHSGLNMRMLWHPGVPHMKLRVFQFDRLLAAHLPRLHAHFRNIRLAPDILVTQWLMTLLAYCLPVRVLIRAWDVCFLDGWKALFRICFALLEAVEEELLPLSLEESGRFLRSWTSKRHPLWRDSQLLLRAARRVKVTRSTLRQLTEEFHLTLLREQLDGVNSGEWLSRYGSTVEEEIVKGRELEGLRREIDCIQSPISADLEYFRKKIEQAGQRHEAAVKILSSIDARLMPLSLEIEEATLVTHSIKDQIQHMKGCQKSTDEVGSSERPAADAAGEHISELILANPAGRQLAASGTERCPRPRLRSRSGKGASHLEDRLESSASALPRARGRPRGAAGSLDRATCAMSDLMERFVYRLTAPSAPPPVHGSWVWRSPRFPQPDQSEASHRKHGNVEMVVTDDQTLRRDLLVQTRELIFTEERLDSLHVNSQKLYAERAEVVLALEEAGRFRASLSNQLHQLLQETEERINGRLRDVVRGESGNRSSVGLALSPNVQVLQSVRSAHRKEYGAQQGDEG